MKDVDLTLFYECNQPTASDLEEKVFVDYEPTEVAHALLKSLWGDWNNETVEELSNTLYWLRETAKNPYNGSGFRLLWNILQLFKDSAGDCGYFEELE